MSSSTERVREYRRRERDGRRVFHLELEVAAIEALLVHEGLIDPLIESEHAAVDRALQSFVEQLAELIGGSRPQN